MNLHEYQAKQVLAGFGVPVPRGVPVLEPEAIEAAVDELGRPRSGWSRRRFMPAGAARQAA